MCHRPWWDLSRPLSNHDITHSCSLGARSGRCFSPRAFLWPAVLETGIGVDTGDCAGLCRFGDHGNSAHRLRAIGLDASEREIEGPGMPEAAGTPARPGLADSAAGKEFGTARTAPHSTERGERSTRSEEHTSELQSHSDLVCRLLLEKKKKKIHRKRMILMHRRKKLRKEVCTIVCR